MIRLKRVRDQVVVVVGASSGIGREAALTFASLGARVVLAARSTDDLAELVQEIERRGGRAIAVPTDVSRYEEVERLASAAVDAYGRIDTWLHLAATTLYAKLADTTPDEFRHVVEVDLLGQAHGAMAALPWLRREGRGALIHVSSVEALRALPYQAAYAASKHGVKGMLEALRMELRRDHLPIAVTNVMPSSIDTPAFRKATTKLGVEPRGIPPLYDPRLVVRALVRAAEHPQRDVVVGASGRLLIFLQAISPRLTDAVLRPFAFWAQRTRKPKGPAREEELHPPEVGVLTRVVAAAVAGLAIGGYLGGRRSRRR